MSILLLCALYSVLLRKRNKGKGLFPLLFLARSAGLCFSSPIILPTSFFQIPLPTDRTITCV